MTITWDEPTRLSEDWRTGLLGEGKLFEVVEDDVLGTRLPVFAQRSRSLGEQLAKSNRFEDRPFLIAGDRRIRYDEAAGVVATAAAHLASRHAVGPGDRVAFVGANTPQQWIGIWAAMVLGAIAVPLNARWTRAELAHALAVAEPRVVFVDDGVDVDRGTVPMGDIPIEPPGTEPPATVAAVDEDAPAAIVFTSGTTGRPKGATLSHRNAIQFGLAAAATSAVHSILHELPAGASDAPAVIGSAPLFHVSGLLGQLVNSVAWGTTVVLPPPGRWDATTHLALSAEHRVTAWSLVPTQLARLIDHPDLTSYDLSTLSNVGGGGATFSPELLRRTGERLPHVTLALRVGYGMTEVSGTVTLAQPPVAEPFVGSVGTPVAGTEVQIRDTAGQVLPDGEIGEIFARSAQVFLGYWNNPTATEAVLDNDRWYATGDYGRIVEGHLFLESRLRDLIIRGGENIYPIEIENRLVEHPAVAEAAVLGAPHHDLGQEVRAVLVLRPGVTPTDDEIRAFVAETLATYKVPTIIEHRDELPQNDNGKVLKHLL